MYHLQLLRQKLVLSEPIRKDSRIGEMYPLQLPFSSVALFKIIKQEHELGLVFERMLPIIGLFGILSC